MILAREVPGVERLAGLNTFVTNLSGQSTAIAEFVLEATEREFYAADADALTEKNDSGK